MDAVETYCAVKRQDRDHPKLLFRNAVIQERRGEYNVFVMKDKLSVEQAVNRGAVELADSAVELTG